MSEKKESKLIMDAKKHLEENPDGIGAFFLKKMEEWSAAGKRGLVSDSELYFFSELDKEKRWDPETKQYYTLNQYMDLCIFGLPNPDLLTKKWQELPLKSE